MSYTVQLKGDAEALIQFLSQHPNGAAIEEIEKATGIPAKRAYWMADKLSRWSVGIAAKRSTRKLPGGKSTKIVKMQYYPAKPEVVVAVSTDKKPPKPDMKGKTSTPTPEPSGNDNGNSTKETEVIFPPAPDVVDVEEDYAYFDHPDYYKLLKSKLLEYSLHIAMKGPPGFGKSSAFEYMAGEEFKPLVNVNADAGLRARQLIGGMTDNGRFEVAEFAAAVVNGWWAKIDEVNGADPDALLALNSLLAPPHRINIHGRMYKVHPQFRLCVTYNPGLTGTKPLPTSLMDRFYHIPVNFPTESRLKKMMAANGIDMSLPEVQQIVKFTTAMFKARAENRIRYEITMRRLVHAWTDLQSGYPVHVALRQSVLGVIDNATDQVNVNKILREIIPAAKDDPMVIGDDKNA